MHRLEALPGMTLSTPAVGELSVVEQVARQERDSDLHSKELLRRLIKQQISSNEANPNWFPEHVPNADVVFNAYLQTDQFRQAYAKLESLANRGRVPYQKRQEFKGRVHADISEASARTLVDLYAPDGSLVLLPEQLTKRFYMRVARERGLMITPTTYDFHEGIRGISVPDGIIATVSDDPQVVGFAEYTSFKTPQDLEAQCSAYQMTVDRLRQRGSQKAELFVDQPVQMVITTRISDRFSLRELRTASQGASIAWNYNPLELSDFIGLAAATIRSGVPTGQGIAAMQAYYGERSGQSTESIVGK
jgi:hypothetical protein